MSIFQRRRVLEDDVFRLLDSLLVKNMLVCLSLTKYAVRFRTLLEDIDRSFQCVVVNRSLHTPMTDKSLQTHMTYEIEYMFKLCHVSLSMGESCHNTMDYISNATMMKHYYTVTSMVFLREYMEHNVFDVPDDAMYMFRLFPRYNDKTLYEWLSTYLLKHIDDTMENDVNTYFQTMVRTGTASVSSFVFEHIASSFFPYYSVNDVIRNNPYYQKMIMVRESTAYQRLEMEENTLLSNIFTIIKNYLTTIEKKYATQFQTTDFDNLLKTILIPACKILDPSLEKTESVATRHDVVDLVLNIADVFKDHSMNSLISQTAAAAATATGATATATTATTATATTANANAASASTATTATATSAVGTDVPYNSQMQTFLQCMKLCDITELLDDMRLGLRTDEQRRRVRRYAFLHHVAGIVSLLKPNFWTQMIDTVKNVFVDDRQLYHNRMSIFLIKFPIKKEQSIEEWWDAHVRMTKVRKEDKKKTGVQRSALEIVLDAIQYELEINEAESLYVLSKMKSCIEGNVSPTLDDVVCSRCDKPVCLNKRNVCQRNPVRIP